MIQRLVENTLHTFAHFRLYRLKSNKVDRQVFRELTLNFRRKIIIKNRFEPIN